MCIRDSAETDTVNENVFRATFTDPFQGIKMADYAYQKLGYTKACLLYTSGSCCSLSLHRFHTSSAVSPFSTPS